MATGRIALVTMLLVCAAAVAPAARGQSLAPESTPEFYAAEPVLREFVLRALVSQPGLKEAEARYGAALQRVPQVTALPDPTVSFTQMLRSVETRVGPQLNTVMLTQTFPWFGKLDLRGQMATAEAVAAFETWQARRRDVIAQVKSAFYNLGYADTAIAITLEEQSILDHYEQLAQDRYAAGLGLQQAVIKVDTELTRVLNRLLTLRQQRQVLASRLNTLVDRAPDVEIESVTLAESSTAGSGTIDLSTLLATGEANRHEVLAADALVDRSERSIALATRNAWPDLTIGAGVINVGQSRASAMTAPPDSGKNAWTVSVGVALPIWRDKLRAGVRQAGQEREAQQQSRSKIVNDIQFEVRDQVIRLQTLAEQIRLFQDVLLPQAREAQDSTEAAYQTGQVSVLDLLDSERVLLDVRLANERQRVDYLVAQAELERAVGVRFPR
jgi:outer membrane protein, heavy metal efflux system